MDKIVEIGNKFKSKDKIQVKNDCIKIEMGNDDNFLFAYVNEETKGAKSIVSTAEPEDAIFICICLMKHIQDAFGCTKGELLSDIIELCVDCDKALDDCDMGDISPDTED